MNTYAVKRDYNSLDDPVETQPFSPRSFVTFAEVNCLSIEP
jgi:hypothetical protein